MAFDLLALGEESLMTAPFSDRRTLLEEALRDVQAPVHLTRTTDDPHEATSWFSEFEGAGLDGVVAKPLRAPSRPADSEARRHDAHPAAPRRDRAR